jgi:hypothetical protein
MSMYDAAIYYIKTYGWYLVPIPHGKKGPTTEGWNKPENTINTIEGAQYWKDHPDENMGVLLEPSNLVVLDIDNVDETKQLFSTFGLDYDTLLKGAPRIIGKGGHDKAIFTSPGIPLGRKSLDWDNKEDDKKHTVFELRGGFVQDVLPPSMHPDTKKPYSWLVSPNSTIPELPKTLLEIWKQWDTFRPQLQYACPWAKKKEEPPKPPRKTTEKSGENIIGKFNSEFKVTKILESHGYKKVSENRYLSPHSTTGLAGVIVFPKDNRIFSHHGSEPFDSSKPHDAFDLFCSFECGGDTVVALQRASTMLFEKEISHGKSTAERFLEPEPPQPDEEFVLRVPPNENIITKWQEFGVRTQDAYPEYHIATMMVFISHLIRAEMRPQYGTVGNNMWCIILGSSGVSGKSTACNALVSLSYTEELIPYVFRLTNKITPEAFTASLAEHGRRFHYSDECAGFLKFLRRDYAADLPEDMIKAYDGQTVSKTTIGMKGKGGAVIALHPRMSLLWNTVPGAFGETAIREQFNSGFFLRPFFIMPQREKSIMRDAPMDHYCRELKEDIILRLANLCRVIGGRTVVFEESEYITEWKHSLRIESSKNGHTDAERSALNRIYEQARKAAMNLTLASTGFYNDVVEENRGAVGNLVGLTEIHYDIPEIYAKIACDWAGRVFYKNSLRALKLTYGYGPYGKIMMMLEDGGEMTRTEIGDIAHKTGRQLTEFLADLPLVSEQRKVPGTNRPTTYYRLS